jgi:hypothetical protein
MLKNIIQRISILSIFCMLIFLVGQALSNPIIPPSPGVMWAIPEFEQINANIKQESDQIKASVDGFYRFNLSYSSGVVLYPLPPRSENVSFLMNGQELNWSYSNITYPTRIGNFSVIEASLPPPVPFPLINLETHYKHNIPLINNSYAWLYPMGTSRLVNITYSTFGGFYNVSILMNITIDAPAYDLKAYLLKLNQTSGEWNIINVPLDARWVALGEYNNWFVFAFGFMEPKEKIKNIFFRLDMIYFIYAIKPPSELPFYTEQPPPPFLWDFLLTFKVYILFHKIVTNGQTFYIVTESNSTIYDFNFSKEKKAISFTVEGDAGTVGFCNITVPKSLLSGPYTIKIDNETILNGYRPPTNGTHEFIYITYNHSKHTIEVIGTTVIPEFPTHAILTLTLILVFLIVTIIKKKGYISSFNI